MHRILALFILASAACAHTQPPVEGPQIATTVKSDPPPVESIQAPKPRTNVLQPGEGINCGNRISFEHGFQSCGFRVALSFPKFTGGLRYEEITTVTGKTISGFPYLAPHGGAYRRDFVEAFAWFEGKYYMITSDHVFEYDPESDDFTDIVHLEDVMMLEGDAVTSDAIVGGSANGSSKLAGIVYYDHGWKQVELKQQLGFAPNKIEPIDAQKYGVSFDRSLCTACIERVIIAKDGKVDIQP